MLLLFQRLQPDGWNPQQKWCIRPQETCRKKMDRLDNITKKTKSILTMLYPPQDGSTDAPDREDGEDEKTIMTFNLLL